MHEGCEHEQQKKSYTQAPVLMVSALRTEQFAARKPGGKSAVPRELCRCGRH